MSHHAGIEAVGQGVVEAAEHHTARGEGLKRGQAEALAHTAAAPVVGGVVEHHAGAAEQLDQIVDPALLELHPQPPIPQGRHQPLQHVAAVLAHLHQHVDRPPGPRRGPGLDGSAPRIAPGHLRRPRPQPFRIEGIGHQEERVAGRPIPPVAQGVATHRQHRHAGRQIQAIAAAVGVVGHGAAPQASQQPGHIKAPAHDPEGLARGGLPAQEVIEKRMLRLPLAVGDHLHPPLAHGRQKADGLELHQQAAATKMAAGAR